MEKKELHLEKNTGIHVYANFLVTVSGGCLLPLQVLGFCAAGNHFAVHQGLGDCHHFGLHRSGALFIECILEPKRIVRRSAAVRYDYFPHVSKI